MVRLMEIGKRLVLPCGFTLRNRIGKSALTECLADAATGDPNGSHFRLYERWAQGEPGFLISGNVMVDRQYREAPRNMVLDEKSSLDSYRKLTEAVHSVQGEPVAFIAQLNHPGRQTPLAVTTTAVAPSSIKVSIPGTPPLFPTPRALETEEVYTVIKQYVTSAKLAKEVGFDGVQIHAAHGYLISQFLSPLVNQRSDKWGGSEEARSLFLFEILQQIRAEVGEKFIVSVKLNSADFKRSCFTNEQSMNVMKLLANTSVDFVEISGGTYESAEMMKNPESTSTEREAFFIKFAQQARETVPDLRLMLTGGFRTATAMEWALANRYIDLVGMGRPFCVEPDIPKKLISGEIQAAAIYPLRFGPDRFKHITMPALNNFWHQQQMKRIAKKKSPDLNLGKIYCLTIVFFRTYIWDWQYHPTRNTIVLLTLFGISAILAFYKASQ